MAIPTISQALSEPNHPVSLKFQILLGMANAGTTMTLIPVLTVLVPSQVTEIDPIHSANNLAFVLTLGAVAALISNPLAGALSDRTTSRFGRRRPWLFIGMIGSAMGMILLANSRNIPLLTIGWITAQFFGNILLSSYGAILPDYVPVRQRGATQAVIGLASPIAIILADLLFTQARNLRSAYYPVIAILVISTVLFLLHYHEPALPKENAAPFRPSTFLTSLWINPRKQPGFALAWLMWLLIWSGYNLGTGGFFFLYVQNITGYENLFPGHAVKEGIAAIQMLQIVIGVPLMMAFGVLSDRRGKRKFFVMTGALLIFAGLVILAGFSTWPIVLAAGVLIGSGFWIFYSLGLAMITQILPSASERGKDLGVINIASTLPQIIMPLIGALIVNSLGVTHPDGYQILFMIGATTSLAGLLIIRSIQTDDRR